MAATNFTPIQLYNSTTLSAVPSAANLANGELAINIRDGTLYYKDWNGVVQVIATKGAGTIGGSTTQIQYNNAGALAGNAAMVFNSGTSTTTLTTLNLTNALGAIYGGTAQSTYTQGDFVYASAANTLSKLGIGTINYILTSTGSVPQWVAPSSIAVLTATNLAGGLAGSVPYQSALDTTTFLAIGAANRVMTSTGTAPQWVTSLTGLTGVSSSSITDSGLTSGRVTFASTSGLLADSANLTFNGTTLTTAGLSNSGFSTLVKTLTLGDTSFNGTAVFAAATPAKLYMGTGTVTDVTSAISATNTTGAIASLAITPIDATNTGVTYTNASTLYIAGAPSAGTNITITNPYSLYVAGGAVYLGGNTAVTGTLSATGNTTVGAGSGSPQLKLSGAASSTANSGAQLAFAAAGTPYAYISNVAWLKGGGSTDNNLAYWTDAGLGHYFYANNNATTAVAAITSTGLAVTGTLSSTLGATIQGLTVGLGAGAVATNTAVGSGALAANISGANSTAVGYGTLPINTASSNTALGSQAGNGVTSATNMIAIGYRSIYGNSGFVTGGSNIGIGNETFYNLLSGTNNVAIGHQSLYSNNTASNNTAVGFEAGYSVSTSTSNAFFGYRAGKLATAGNCTAIGNNAMGQAITTGGEHTAVGDNSLTGCTSGQFNVAVGRSSLAATNSGSSNTAVGTYALINNSSGNNNVAVGYQAGYLNQTTNSNVFVGQNSGYTHQTGQQSVYLGYYTGYYWNGATGSNTFLGSYAGEGASGLSTGNYNTFVGYGSGASMQSGSKNTIIGSYNGNSGGLDIRTASNYIVLSDGDGNPRFYCNGTANKFSIGNAPIDMIGTARLNIDGSGNQTSLNLKGNNISTPAGAYVQNATTTGDGQFFSFGTEASYTERGSITYNRAGGLTAYNVTSDYRAKDIIGPVTNSGALIDSIPVYMGKMHGATQERPMFIAHETPVYAHTGEKDAVDENGNPKYQQMDASALIPVMWAEIQSLRKRLADAGI